MHCLTFTRESQSYCVQMEFVSEVVPDTPLIRFPRMPACFDGLFQLRGRPITVFNPFQSMKLTDSKALYEIIVFAPPWEHFSIRVPGLVETITVPSFEIKSAFDFGEIICDEEQEYHLLSVEKMISFSKESVLEMSVLFEGAK